MRYYRCFVDLYNIFFVDVSPLLRISTYFNKCFVEQDLRDFNVDSQSYNIFKDISISDEKKKYIDENREAILLANKEEEDGTNQ